MAFFFLIMKPYGCIYILKSPSNKYYIGQTTLDFDFYIKRQYFKLKGIGRPKLNYSILKYGFENFQYLKYVELFSKEELDTVEIELIKEFNSISNGYNIHTGGHNGPPSEETRFKLSLAHLGKPKSKEHCENISKGKTGLKLSQSHCDAIGLSRLGINTITKDHEQVLRESRCKFIYSIINTETDEIFEVKHIRQFCKDHGINSGHITHRGKSNGYLVLSKEPKCTL